MNPLKELRDQIQGEFPSAKIETTEPAHGDGIWWLDVTLGTKTVTVDWHSNRGFGISDTLQVGYGEGPDEKFASIADTKRRLLSLLGSNEKPAPPLQYLLGRLRERMGLTQGELARRLNVTQATVSGIERRGDVQLSTLARVINALNGALEVYAVFADARYKIVLPGSAHEPIDDIVRDPIPFSRREGGNAFTCLEKTGQMSRARDRQKRILQEHSIMAT